MILWKFAEDRIYSKNIFKQKKIDANLEEYLIKLIVISIGKKNYYKSFEIFQYQRFMIAI